ncbi:MAG: protein kinase domain-containing protein [Acidimicrobiales bacterium]
MSETPTSPPARPDATRASSELGNRSDETGEPEPGWTAAPNPSRAGRAAHPGLVLGGRYELDEVIATGGMAQVWRGVDHVLGRPVAVKVLHPHLAADAAFVTRFRREAVAAARVHHPSIVAIYDTCSENGLEAIVMELVEGRNLRAVLDERRQLDLHEAVMLAAAVAAALEEAHRAGLVHRDIKPANLLLRDDQRVVVTDFGIAKSVGEITALTQAGSLLGTAKYLSPEQVEGADVDARTDIYALGVVLYEAVSGRAPFSGDSDLAIAMARLHTDPLRPRQLRAAVSRPLDALIMRALARRKTDRFQSAADLRAALLAADPGPDPAPPNLDDTAVAPVSFRTSERSWLAPALAVTLIAAMLGAAGLLLGRTERGQDILDSALDAVGVVDAAPNPTRSTPAPPGPALPIARVTDFDPFGDDKVENTQRLPYVTDGDTSTTWRTVGYTQQFPALKPGVGLVIELAADAKLTSLSAVSPSESWAADIFVAGQPADQLEGWGEPTTTAAGLSGDAVFDLAGKRGRYVLLWITGLTQQANGQYRTEIGEISVHS